MTDDTSELHEIEREQIEEHAKLATKSEPGLHGFQIGMLALYLGLSGAAGTTAALAVDGWLIATVTFVSAALVTFGLLVIVGLALEDES
jgi:hypothetical protein